MGITMGRSRLGMALGIAAVLLLALGALAWTIGTTKLALADTPTTTYTQCPSYRQFQYDVEQVQPYQSGTFIFPPNCSYDPSSTPSGVTSSLRFNGEATVKIEGNGLTISGSTTTTPGSFDLISFLADDQMPLTTLELDGVTLELGANCINTGSNEGIESIDLTLVDTTLSDCQSDGVLDSNVGSTNITVSDSTFYHNGQSGIDIDSNDNDPSTQVNLSITGSTFGLNGSSGINLDTSATTSNLNLTNSTLAGNNSSGIQLASYGRHVTANLTYDTIANDGIYGIFNSNIGEGYAVTLAGTIISGNLDNCFQPVTDGGFNFEGSAHGTQNSCDFSGSTRGSRAVTDAALGLQPLADNGGPTQTMALDTNLPSVAINAIPSADCATIIDPITNLPVTADQRGVPRPQGAGCDSGAYEAITVPYTVTYSSCPTQAGLQNDFDLAASTSGNPLTIDVTQPNCIIPVASAFNDPALGPTAFEIPKGANVTLNGDGLALAGSSGNISIIDAGSSASLTVNGVTFEGGSYGITANGSSITVSDSTFTRDPVGIGNTGGTVTVTDSTFSNDGEGIIGTNSTVTVTGSTFTGMKSGIDDTQNSSTLTTTVVNSTFSGDGFGIYDRDGTTRVISSTFDDNSLSDIYSNSYMPAVFTASILAGGGCGGSGLVTDGGYNLTTSQTCHLNSTSKVVPTTGPGGLNLANDGALGSYGGPTQTIALGPGSAAIDFVPSSFCATLKDAGGNPLTTDQRGVTRPQGNGCDAGAYEAPSLSLNVSPASPNGNPPWYKQTPTVTLGTGGLDVGQTASCTQLSGLTITASQPDQSGSAQVLPGDGQYSIDCGVAQGQIALGFSYSGASLPLTLDIDTTPPTIDLQTPAATTYTLQAKVEADYSCSDPKAPDGAVGSGITAANCKGSVPSGQPVDTGTPGQHKFTVSASDNAGNTTTKSVTYTVAYATPSLPGSTTTVQRGYYALIRFAPEDVNGHDYASRNLKVTTVELDGDGQTIPFVHQFQFAQLNGQPGYQLEINTRSLAPGSWTLEVTIGNAATLYPISFTVE